MGRLSFVHVFQNKSECMYSCERCGKLSVSVRAFKKEHPCVKCLEFEYPENIVPVFTSASICTDYPPLPATAVRDLIRDYSAKIVDYGKKVKCQFCNSIHKDNLAASKHASRHHHDQKKEGRNRSKFRFIELTELRNIWGVLELQGQLPKYR